MAIRPSYKGVHAARLRQRGVAKGRGGERVAFNNPKESRRISPVELSRSAVLFEISSLRCSPEMGWAGKFTPIIPDLSSNAQVKRGESPSALAGEPRPVANLRVKRRQKEGRVG
jgi:hypothetical protein